jgi:FtsH-binding integral membrane protein
VSDAFRQHFWVDADLTRAQREAHDLAMRALDRPEFRAYDRDGLNSEDIAQTVGFVTEVAKAEQDRETNLNTRGAAVATVAGLIVPVSSAVAKPVFDVADWSDWTKIAAVSLFLAALFVVTAAMVIAVVAVLRPKRGPRTKNFLGETLVNLWRNQYAASFVRADKDRLNLLAVDRSMRTLPEWHFRNRGKARWLRRAWMLLTIGIVLTALVALLVLARVLGVTAVPKAGGPAEDLTWGWLVVMIAGTAVLTWIALHFDWLGAGRSEQDASQAERDNEELALIAKALPVSPLATAVSRGHATRRPDREGTGGDVDPAVNGNGRAWTLTLRGPGPSR